MGFFDKVKDIAGDVGDAVSKGAKNVSESSKKAAEKMKLKKEINKVEGSINSLYSAIGKKYFDLNSAAPSNEYAEEINSIITFKSQLEALNSELNTVDGKVECTVCGAALNIEQKFCDSCGTKREIPVAPAPEPTNNNALVCECGSPYTESQMFCEACGKKVKNDIDIVDTKSGEVIE